MLSTNDDDLGRYLDAHSTPPDAIQQRLIETTSELGGISMMQIGPDQGAFLQILVASIEPRFAVEIGTFTGYSSLAIARGLPDGGRLLCCDVSEEWTAVAREHWELAGVSDRIELRIAPARDTLAALDDDVEVDFAFIDADKTGYLDYYEALVPRLSPKGLIAVDNTLWSGRVLLDDATDDDTVALRAFNDHVVADDRTLVALTPIGDGVTLIRLR
jgi:caffeoyl-CoA O-methyltransferase